MSLEGLLSTGPTPSSITEFTITKDMARKWVTCLITLSITTVLVEKPLASPGSANYCQHISFFHTTISPEGRDNECIAVQRNNKKCIAIQCNAASWNEFQCNSVQLIAGQNSWGSAMQ